MHVGALDPHKNFEAVVKSFAALQSHEDILLVVVGELSGSLLEYERWFRASCVHNVLFTGFLDRNILEILYQDALALLFCRVMKDLACLFWRRWLTVARLSPPM